MAAASVVGHGGLSNPNPVVYSPSLATSNATQDSSVSEIFGKICYHRYCTHIYIYIYIIHVCTNLMVAVARNYMILAIGRVVYHRYYTLRR